MPVRRLVASTHFQFPNVEKCVGQRMERSTKPGCARVVKADALTYLSHDALSLFFYAKLYKVTRPHMAKVFSSKFNELGTGVDWQAGIYLLFCLFFSIYFSAS